MKLIAVVAASENNVIGIDNKMPWHLPDDFKFFKKTTLGHTILMGRHTWISLGRALPGRDNWIISSTLSLNENQVQSFSSVEAALKTGEAQGLDKLFVIGGGKIYNDMFPLLDTIIMTRVHTVLHNGDAFFPEILTSEWQKTTSEFHPRDEKHAFDFTFETWERVI